VDEWTQRVARVLAGSLRSTRNLLHVGSKSLELRSAVLSHQPYCQWHETSWESLDPPTHFNEVDVVYLEPVDLTRTELISVLSQLRQLLSSQVRVFVKAANGSHLKWLSAMVCGEQPSPKSSPLGSLEQSSNDLLSSQLTIPSLIKLLLDAGWMPTHVDSRWDDRFDPAFGQSMLAANKSFGISEDVAKFRLGSAEVLWECTAMDPPIVANHSSVAISWIVAVNRPWQFEANLLASPGLREMDSQVIPIMNATSAADAFQRGCSQAKHDWRIFLHQDIYVPAGSGFKLIAELHRIQQAGLHTVPIGFFGAFECGANHEAGHQFCGSVIDRIRRHDHVASMEAKTLDEFAVAFHKQTCFLPDANLGWHLWATDLCQQVAQATGRNGLPVVRVPLFHNSIGAYAVPTEFLTSANCLMEKYPQLPTISTICGYLIREPNGEKRFEEPLRVLAAQPS
jgi:hypothetical protein